MNKAIEFYESIAVGTEAEKECAVCPVTKEVGRRGIFLAATGSAILGLWGLICLVAGLCACENLVAFKDMVVMALTGM